MRWRYLYPQVAFPYDDLISENARRSQLDPEYELADTVRSTTVSGTSPSTTRRRRQRTWCWSCARATQDPRADAPCPPDAVVSQHMDLGLTDTKPALHVEDRRIVADHTVVGRMFLTGDGDYMPLVCDNESNAERLWAPRHGALFQRTGSTTT